MDYFPVFLNLRDKHALLIGGNALAARKAALIAKSGAHITVLAENFSAPMLALAQGSEQFTLSTAAFSATQLDKVALVLAATDDEHLNQRVYDTAVARGIPVNVADRPELCSYILPAIVDRAPVVIAVSTGGRSPVLARFVKALLERSLPQTLGPFATLLKRWRRPVTEAIAHPQQRRRFWEQLISGPIGQQALSGNLHTASEEIADALNREVCTNQEISDGGSLALIGAPAQDPELLSLKAHRLIQQAEWFIYDDQTPAALQELSRREAHTLNADRHNVASLLDTISSKVDSGQRVVRLYGRDCGLRTEARNDQLALQQRGIKALSIPAANAPFSALPAAP